MDTAAMAKEAQTTLALVEMVEAMRKAETCSVQFPDGDLTTSLRRTVAFSFATDAQAQQFFSATQKAASRIG